MLENAPDKSTMQYHKDFLLLRKLLTGERGKSYVDIGANDPVEHSNTYWLSRMGWCGPVYEPYPDLLKWSQKRYHDTVVVAAVSNYEGHAFMLKDGMLSRLISEDEVRCQDCEIVHTVDAYTIVDCDYMDFCSIDAEGHEATIINRLNWGKTNYCFNPGVVMVEAVENKTHRELWHEWEPTLLAAGYEFMGMPAGLNRFYKHKEYGNG